MVKPIESEEYHLDNLIKAGSEAVLHMSKIELKFRPIQINSGRLN